MFRQIAILLLICFASLSAFAQTEKYTAPVKWERYKVGNKDISVLFPKLPVLVGSSDACRGEETKQYATYADQTVYGLIITSKVKTPVFCSQIKGFKEFDEQSFADRLVELKNSSPETKETNFKQDNLTVIKIVAKITTYWLINDFANKRWFELLITDGNEEKAEVKNFIKSLEINKKTQGIEIGNGVDRTLGDENVKTIESKDGDTSAIIISLRPQPRYTEAARKASVQGTTTLKVTFLANGGIGSISPEDELPNGLTEQAVLAAQRIVFIPPKRNGISYAVSKRVIYHFTIY